MVKVQIEYSHMQKAKAALVFSKIKFELGKKMILLNRGRRNLSSYRYYLNAKHYKHLLLLRKSALLTFERRLQPGIPSNALSKCLRRTRENRCYPVLMKGKIL